MNRLTLPLRLLGAGMVEEVTLPRFGSQDMGISPGGAMDCFSLRRGNRMLGNREEEPALEMVAAPDIELGESCSLVMTGAPLAGSVVMRGETPRNLEHSQVFMVEPGDRIRFGRKLYGFRTYLCLRRSVDGTPPPLLAIPFSRVGRWMHERGSIRILPGPEYQLLDHPDRFWTVPWKTSSKMDKMGIRLEGGAELSCRRFDIVSEAVADGTVQMTTGGPIILLRHRQTTGGYPRVFNVISADIDLLAQYGPHQLIRFQPVEMEEARAVAARKESLLERMMTV